MARRRVPSRRLVVDTDVVRSAGTTEHPVSVACRSVLDTILDVCHQIVLSPRQHDEWRSHQSRYTGGWLIQMFSRKKCVLLPEDPDSGIAATVDALDVTHKVRVAMWKDAHLIEMAVATDRRVLSMDERAYRYYHESAAHVQTCRIVHWVNPMAPEDDAVGWLENGAPDDADRCIGQRPPRGT